MLTRRREQLVLLFGLIALNALWGWYLHRLWIGYRGHTQWIYAPIAAGSAATLTASPRAPAGAQSFTEIVDRNLFTPDRTSHPPNENVKAPELPLLYGTMNLGDGWFALMASGDQSSGLSRRVVPGEKIGGYTLVSLSSSQVEVEWGGKKFTIDVSESARRVPRVIEKTAKTSAAHPVETPPANVRSTTPVTSVAPVSRPAASDEKTKSSAAGYNAPAGAPPDAPAGTIFGGKRKVVNPTPFGDQVSWVDVESSEKSAGKESEKK